MASSYYTNTLHGNFESVLAMDDPGMVTMFQVLMASGLEGFLGCPAVIYEDALVDFFENASVQDDKTVHRYIVLNEKIGAEEAAHAPKVKKAPKKQAAFKKRPAAAAVGEPVLKKKRMMKKKSGSSQDNLEIVVVAQEAVPIQITEPIPAALVVEPSVEEQREASSAVPIDEDISAVEQPAVEKSGSSQDNLEIVVVAQEAVPIQITEPIPAALVVEPSVEEQREASSAVPIDEDISAVEQPAVEVAAATSVQEPATEHVDEQMAETTADVESIVKEFDEPAVEVTAEEVRPSSADDVDNIIEQVLAETAHIEADEKTKILLHLMLEINQLKQLMGRSTDQQLQTVDTADCFVDKLVEDTETEADELSADEAMSIEDILLKIPVDVPLPSAGVEIQRLPWAKISKFQELMKEPGTLPIFLRSNRRTRGRSLLRRKTQLRVIRAKEKRCRINLFKRHRFAIANFKFPRLVALYLATGYFFLYDVALSLASGSSIDWFYCSFLLIVMSLLMSSSVSAPAGIYRSSSNLRIFLASVQLVLLPSLALAAGSYRSSWFTMLQLVQLGLRLITNN
ncbi:hypothetical protein F511_29579 [Dorcoceras hygrometricum]|uniref:Uncharacterized protein n=1 Tax=Dorcoceras hygrometricum TaxID=472368 RepID=A0A2Z7B5I7_9LAMI|nr:hypothetical protein F511_29579 [Dorcoceras hygrometricum]